MHIIKDSLSKLGFILCEKEKDYTYEDKNKQQIHDDHIFVNGLKYIDSGTRRNGHSSKTMHTSYGDMDVAIPSFCFLICIPASLISPDDILAPLITGLEIATATPTASLTSFPPST